MNKSNFVKFPEVWIKGFTGFEGWENITSQLLNSIENDQQKKVLVLEVYPGASIELLIQHLRTSIPGIHCVNAADCLKTEEEIDKLVFPFVTDDPVFGYITPLQLNDFFDEQLLKQKVAELNSIKDQVILVYGTGASIVAPKHDLVIYADMPRWEIQLRFRRNETGNLGASNKGDEFAYKYRRAFFVDWRVCDRIKVALFDSIDYVLDTTVNAHPKMISGEALRESLKQVAKKPFRVVPFFDPGPWGGQWLKEVCDLDRNEVNFAWGFDCVPEENSLLLKFDNIIFETPSINLVFYRPEQLLGKKVYEVFGAEFPIRFDFLDTMQGGNLSLQVHPLKEYIHEKFGMNYTQDESYYFLDVQDDSFVYLGLKDNIVPEKMLQELEAAQEKDGFFDADLFVEKWPVKKHDHVLIPAGTVHCSGANSVVLEISATPYIFTFKLWDWGRMGLNGKPRPISLAHGKNSIQWDRTTNWTKEHIRDRVEQIGAGDGWIEERTGLHDGSFIETRRHWFSKKVTHDTNGIVNILNLVEGREVIVESPENAFEPYIIHYAETFIVPAEVGSYTIRPFGESEGKQCGTVKAFVRTENLVNNRIN